jgi:hypothetical protein
MLRRLLMGPHAVEEAETTAADLRRRYGADAEHRCDAFLAKLPRGDRRRRGLRDARWALRFTPMRHDGRVVRHA